MTDLAYPSTSLLGALWSGGQVHQGMIEQVLRKGLGAALEGLPPMGETLFPFLCWREKSKVGDVFCYKHLIVLTGLVSWLPPRQRLDIKCAKR